MSETDFRSAAVDHASATLAEMTSRAQEEAANVASRLHDKASELGHHAAEKLGASADYVREHGMKDVAADLRTYVKAHPTTVLLGAAAIGVVAAVILRRS
jgi:ElaB/YqjD/DUF883 family membrane-anchored ribosome-binding protein